MADTKKNCAREGRTIVFIDESGVSERPHRVRTRAPRGKTPVLQESFTWNQLSAVAGITFWNIYFKLVKGAIRAPEIVAFLKNLRRHPQAPHHLGFGLSQQVGVIHFWRVADGVLRHSFSERTGIGVTSPVAWSPDATRFAYGTYEGTAVVALTPAP